MSIPTAARDFGWPHDLKRRENLRLTSEEELAAILGNVAERALTPGAWDAGVLARIAQHARGDARRALAMLRHAIYRAEEAGTPRLHESHLTPANFDHFNPRVEDDLAMLSSHHRILYDIVCAKSPIPGTDLEAAYREACQSQGLASVSSRTISKYLSVLCLKRVLHREHGAGTPAWVYRAALPRA